LKLTPLVCLFRLLWFRLWMNSKNDHFGGLFFMEKLDVTRLKHFLKICWQKRIYLL
jgi:hypothetical protein